MIAFILTISVLFPHAQGHHTVTAYTELVSASSVAVCNQRAAELIKQYRTKRPDLRFTHTCVQH